MRYLGLIIFLLSIQLSSAQQDVMTVVLKGDEIYEGLVVDMQQKLENLTYPNTAYELYVNLSYPNSDNTLAQNNFEDLTISYSIYGEEEVNGTVTQTGIESYQVSIQNSSGFPVFEKIKTLTLDGAKIQTYNEGTSTFTGAGDWLKKEYNGSTMEFAYWPGGRIFNAYFKITNITSTFTSLPSDVTLMIGLRKKVDYQLETLSEVKWNNSTNLLTWEYVKGADSYEVEWIISDGTNADLFTSTDIDPYRITTKGNTFKPNLINAYENPYVQFRVRAIGQFTDDGTQFYGRKHGNWVETGTYLISAYQTNKNWTYQANYVEGGKYKGVINYFDGAHKNRQTKTNLSSTNQTVIQENIYNKEGRTVAQILPVPVEGSSLAYQGNFNKDQSGNKFDYQDVQNDVGLSTSSGASNYYSAANNTESFNKDYIPYAEGYPYSAVRYLNDYTGRVAEAKSPGKVFHAGGKAVKSFYGVPNASELHRLFGKNVGEAKYYKKRVDIDPNNNVTISYFDEGENLVAQSMSGRPPKNLMPLNESMQVYYVDLSGNTELIDNTMVTEASIINTYGDDPDTPSQVEFTPYEFTYDLIGVIYKYKINENGEEVLTICNDCEYELEIEIRDPNGNLLSDDDITYGEASNNAPHPLGAMEMLHYNVVYSPEATFKARFKSFDQADEAGPIGYHKDFCDIDVNSYDPLLEDGTLQFTINATEEGVYTVTKKLKLLTDQTAEAAEAFQEYVDLISNDANFPTDLTDYNGDGQVDYEDYVIETHISEIDIENCLITPEDHCLFEIVTNEQTYHCDEWEPVPINCVTTYHNELIAYEYKGCESGGDGIVYLTDNVINFTIVDDGVGCSLIKYKLEDTQEVFEITVSEYTAIYDYVAVTTCDEDLVCQHETLDPIMFDCNGTAYELHYYQDEFNNYDINYLASNTFPANWDNPPTGAPGGYPTIKEAFDCMVSNCVESEAYLPGDIEELYAPTYNLSCESMKEQMKLDIIPYELNPEVFGAGHLFSTEIGGIFWNTNHMSAYYDFGTFTTNPVSGNIPAIYSEIENPLIGDLNGDNDTTIIDIMLYIDGIVDDVEDNEISEDEFYTYFRNYLNWEDWMADVFVPYHPEYCHYEKCLAKVEPLAYQNELSQVAHWEEAYDLGYLRPVSPLTADDSNIEFEYYNRTSETTTNVTLSDAGINNTLVGETVDNSLTASVKTCATNHLTEFYAYINNNISTPIVAQDQSDKTIYGFIRDYYNDEDVVYDAAGDIISTDKIGINTTSLGYTDEQLSEEKWILFKSLYTGVVHTCIDNEYFDCEYYDSEFANVQNPATNGVGNQNLYDMAMYDAKRYTTAEARAEQAMEQLDLMSDDNPDLSTYVDDAGLYDLIKAYLLKSYGSYNPNCVVPLSTTNYDPAHTEYNTLVNYLSSTAGALEAISLGTYTYPDYAEFDFLDGFDNLESNNYYYSTFSSTPATHPYHRTFEQKILMQNQQTLGVDAAESAAGFTALTSPPFDIKYYAHNGIAFAEVAGVNLNLMYGMHPVDVQAISSLPSGYYQPGIAVYMRDDYGEEIEVFLVSSIDPLNYELWNLELSDNHRHMIYVPEGYTDNNAIEVTLEDIRTECLLSEIDEAIYHGGEEYDDIQDDFISDYINTSINGCFDTPFQETFYYRYEGMEEYNMLYYYDQVGNLSQTVPPEGAEILQMNDNTTSNPGAMSDPEELPEHRMRSAYKYTSTGQLAELLVPDKDYRTLYLYDYKDRLRFEIYYFLWDYGPEMGKLHIYSKYYRYDQLDRLIEVGYQPEQNFKNDASIAGVLGLDPSTVACDDLTNLNQLGEDQNNYCFEDDYPNMAGRDRVHYYYDDYYTRHNSQDDIIPSKFKSGGINHSQNRIASVVYDEDFEPGTTSAENPLGDNTARYHHITHYKYDLNGNVKEVLQEFVPYATNPDPTQSIIMSIEYEYDLISGNVNKVIVQKGEDDQFMYQYHYDEDNRITQVLTSVDGVIWESDAKYFYYAHGPLARVELGHDKVQAMDYAYTLQGWLKGVNSASMQNNRDIGKDGLPGHTNAYVGEDAFGYSLDYYFKDNGGADDYTDYKSNNTETAALLNQFLPANHTTWSEVPSPAVGAFDNPDYESTTGYARYASLYNGNIAAMSTGIYVDDGSNGLEKETQLNYYRYDRLNRFKKMFSFEGVDVINTNSWTNDLSTLSNRYRTDLVYDYNGNIQSLSRKNQVGTSYNTATAYTYPNSAGELISNRLESVNIDGIGTEHYEYDGAGRLIKNEVDVNNQTLISWNFFDKVKDVYRSYEYVDNGSTVQVSNELAQRISYDAGYNRVQKTTTAGTDLYLRDAQGNILSIYKLSGNVNDGYSTTLDYHILYGSSRLGIQNASTASVNTDENIRERGLKRYELSNHLGNVLATVSDLKVGQNVVGESMYLANIQSSQDYYPFGMMMPGRIYQSSTPYKFGFQGQEVDREITGDATHLNYKYRMHDARIGRFFAVDPLSASYPHNSSYAFSENRVIDKVELEGLEIGTPRTPDGGQAETWNSPAARKTSLKIMGTTMAAAIITPVIIFGGEAALPYLASWGLSLAPYATSTALLAGRYGPDAIAFAGGALGYDGEIPGSSGDELGRLVNKGLKYGAYKFYKQFSKYTDGGFNYLASHLRGINFNKDVFTKTYEKGTKLYQWTINGKVTGDYFSKSADATNLGLPTLDGVPAYWDYATQTLKKRTLVEVELDSSVEVLESTASNVKSWISKIQGVFKGGDTQVFSPNIKNNIK